MPKLTPKLVTLRASAALAGAGTWDAAPLEIAAEDADYIAVYLSYTRGGVGGSARVRVEVSPYSAATAGVENWFIPSVKQVGAFAAGVDTNSAMQRENGVLYTATGAVIEDVAYGVVQLGRGVQRVRLLAQEVGAVGTPGILHAVGLMGTYGAEA